MGYDMLGLIDRGCIHCGTAIDKMWQKETFKWQKDEKGREGYICGKCGRWSSYFGGDKE